MGTAERREREPIDPGAAVEQVVAELDPGAEGAVVVENRTMEADVRRASGTFERIVP